MRRIFDVSGPTSMQTVRLMCIGLLVLTHCVSSTTLQTLVAPADHRQVQHVLAPEFERPWPPLVRSRRYVLQGSKWQVNPVTYGVERYPSGLPRLEVDDSVWRAFLEWSSSSALRLLPALPGEEPLIKVRFDPEMAPPGPSRVIASLSKPPQKKGSIVMNDQMRWALDDHPTAGRSGAPLGPHLLHAVGHALGLQHSDAAQSVMSPFPTHNHLQRDDVRAIQALYGRRRQIHVRGDRRMRPKHTDRSNIPLFPEAVRV